MTEYYNLRTDRAYLPPRAEMLPLPQLYRKQKDRSHHWSPCYPAWGLEYYACLSSLKHERPNVIIETGTNHGCSAALLAQTLRETGLPGHVYTFELDPKRAQTAAQLFDELGLGAYITLTVGDSLENLKKVILPDMEVDFAFLDADHAKDVCIAETEQLLENVIAGKGKFFYDNTECGPVDEALCFLKNKYGTSGWVDFPNVSRFPPGQVIWQPWQRTEPVPWYDSNKQPKPKDD